VRFTPAGPQDCGWKTPQEGIERVVLVELSSSDLKIDRTFCFKIGFKTMK
jgi:hypothetical protein